MPPEDRPPKPSSTNVASSSPRGKHGGGEPAKGFEKGGEEGGYGG